MVENNKSHHFSCPSFEDLSAFLDDSSDSEIAAHLCSCESCQAIIASYNQQDLILQELSAAPVDLSAKILTACLAENSPVQATKPSFSFSRSAWFKYAAALALVAAVSILLNLVSSKNLSSEANLASTSQVSIENVGVDASLDHGEVIHKIENPLPEEVFSFTDQLKLQGKINSSSLQNVSLQKNDSSKSRVRKAAVHSSIEHIWMLDNLPQARNTLEKLVAAANCSIKWNELNEQTYLQASINGNDRDIQELVNSLENEKWILLSAAFPQPQQENQTVFNNKTVKYNTTLVKKE